MDHVTVVVGRLVGDDPMPLKDWIRLRAEVTKSLRKLAQASAPDGWWLEVSRGTTLWKGREEDCMMATLMNVPLALVPAIKEALAPLPDRYGQEAIGVRYGTADLVTPA